MKGKIVKLEQAKTKGGKDYMKVTLEGRNFPSPIWDNLKDKWAYLIEGESVELKMVKGDKPDAKGNDTWNCVDIIPQNTPDATPAAPQQTTPYIKESMSADKEERITKLAVLKAAADLDQGKKTIYQMLADAELMLKWVHGDFKNVENEEGK